jgi:hypothetical protein
MFGSEREKSIQNLHDEKDDNFNSKPDNVIEEGNMGRACNIYGAGDKCLNVVRERDKKKTMSWGIILNCT